ncbi:MAG: hypothetical protein BroJett011_43910 [Chloroflexota bacterium]|nr:MAG: hypothetical protein BroJett011_43910 [Chloroflexota bacterium]
MLKPHKIHFILTLSLILLLALVSIAHAAPPLPGNSSLGESLNLDENGNPVDEVDDTGGNNLGTVMSDKTGDTVDDGTTDGGMIGDGTDEVAKQHPVATALAEYFEVDYNEIITMHDAGNGFGNIAKAYFFADQLGLTPQELLLQSHTSGWGNVLKQNGIHPGAVGQGGGKKWGVTGPENSTLEPQNNGAAGLTGPGGHGGNGHGNGNGGGNGQGNGNNNGGGNGGGKGHGGGNGNGHGNK